MTARVSLRTRVDLDGSLGQINFPHAGNGGRFIGATSMQNGHLVMLVGERSEEGNLKSYSEALSLTPEDARALAEFLVEESGGVLASVGICGAPRPSILKDGSDREVCRLRAEHAGWHHGADGSDWSPLDDSQVDHTQCKENVIEQLRAEEEGSDLCVVCGR